MYRNSFHNKLVHGSKEFIESSEIPLEYRGYFIFHSKKSTDKYDNVYDVVKDEILISQRVTLKSCQLLIDELLTKLKQQS